MKIYCGIPAQADQPPGVIVIGDDGEARPLTNAVPLSWNGKTDPGALALGSALMLDVFGHEGVRYATRFRWRIIEAWKPTAPWSITETEIRAIVEEIKTVERESASARAAVAREPKPVGTEGGQGIGWKSAPEIERN